MVAPWACKAAFRVVCVLYVGGPLRHCAGLPLSVRYCGYNSRTGRLEQRS